MTIDDAIFLGSTLDEEFGSFMHAKVGNINSPRSERDAFCNRANDTNKLEPLFLYGDNI